MITQSSTYPELILETATTQMREMERARITRETRRERRHHHTASLWRVLNSRNGH